jgi:hypothetical protein
MMMVFMVNAVIFILKLLNKKKLQNIKNNSNIEKLLNKKKIPTNEK